MDYIRWTDDRPELSNPTLIVAFEGWNDAGEAASGAANHIRDRFGGRQFAEIDPEPFYDFTSTRPILRLEDGNRVVDWPENSFWAIGAGQLPERRPGLADIPDMIVLIGVEPQLQWRCFTEQIVSIVEEFDVEMVITLGALIADVTHSRPTPVYASTYDPGLMSRLDLEPSSYEGPTGIVGVVHNSLQELGYGSISLWGTVPSYVPHATSPKATLALVNRLATLLEISIPTTALEIASAAYERQINDLVDDDEDTRAYISRLEEQYDSSMTPESGRELIEEVEQFLRETGE